MENEKPKILTNNAKEGDVYYFKINERYYFLQIIKICTKTIATKLNGQRTEYCYFIIVFEKSYKIIPENIEEMDFLNIYQVKHKPKNTLLYITCEYYDTPELKILQWDGMYKDRNIFSLNYWGNEIIKKEYNPKIILDSVSWTVNDKKILISPTGANIGYIFNVISNDEKYKNKKSVTIIPKYFHEWSNEIETDIIMKMEEILTDYENSCDKNDVENSLGKCI
ncbi:MAG: hypothetical protein LBP54_04450, partial [Campylobacteraceae bacterium]|nr:hypothetical protein [Campylobacteraceae bacterium]